MQETRVWPPSRADLPEKEKATQDRGAWQATVQGLAEESGVT